MKKYGRLLAILALSIITIFGLLRLGNIDINAETLAQVNGWWFLLSFAIYYSSYLVRGLRWQRILKTMGWPVGFVYAQTLLIAGLFISAILPARAGDIGRVAMLKQDYRIPVAQGIASIATERALDVFSILTLAIIGAVWALHGRLPPEIMDLMIVAVLLFVAGLIGLLAVPSIEQWLRQKLGASRFVSPGLRSFYYRWHGDKVVDFGLSLIHGVRALGQNRLALTLAVAESLYIWLCDGLLIYFSLVSIGAAAHLSISLFAGMVSGLAAAVPLTPAALGQFDAVLVSTLSLFGLDRTNVSLATLLVRFVSLWTFIPISALITYIFGFSRALNLNGKVLAAGEGSAASPAAVES